MLSEFVSDLLLGRALRVGPPINLDEGDILESLQKIRAFERDWRVEMPGSPPELDIDAVRWSMISIFYASSLVIHRDIDESQMNRIFDIKPPNREFASAHYSVDLIMRFLPDIIRLGRSASSKDPLHAHLLNWAKDWPLSSVGIKGLGPVDATPLRTSPTLMRLYVDRILALGDSDRLEDTQVRRLAATVLGDYPELNSEIARVLETKRQLPESDCSRNDEPNR